MKRLSVRSKAICSKMLIVFMLTSLLSSIMPSTKVSAAEVTPPDSNAWKAYQQFLNSDVSKKEDMRATWIVTVYNSDWPSSNSLTKEDATRVEQQKNEIINILDAAVASNLNTVMFQVRPSSDALYKSEIVPWSTVLTGTPGQDPGYDPLQFVIDEAHKRGLELHAWFNPYRAATAINDDMVAKLKQLPNSIFSTHPEWIKRAYDGVYVVDPGIPEAQDWIVDSVMEVVNNYDIDGVHFDDYFYHESQAFDYDDTATFEKYKGGFTDRGDWRRNNTYTLISTLSQEIRTEKPWVQFGISPAGMWGNIKDGHANGSPTAGGAPNYDRAFADTLRWGNEGLIDYLTPQVYWPFGRDVAPYGVIATWWADHLTNPNTKLYMGMGMYRINATTNSTETGFVDPYAKEEIVREIQLNTNYVSSVTGRGIDGSFLYQGSNIVPGTSIYKKEAVEDGVRVVWKNKALAPSSKWKSSVAPAMPTNVTANAVDGVTQVTWTANDETGSTAYYAIYRFNEDDNVSTSDSSKIIAVIGKAVDSEGRDITSYSDTQVSDPSTVKYVVTALDRLHNESSTNASTPVSAIDAVVETATGIAPVLPVSVKVNMSSGDSANMMVKWEKVTDSNLYSTFGNSFDVIGTVINNNGSPTEIKAKAHVTVVEPKIKYINPIVVETEEKTAPVFPATVDVIYTDNSVKSLPVTWETPDPADYQSAAPFGEYLNPSVVGITGTVIGTDMKAEGNYIVYPAITSYDSVAVKTREGIPPLLPTSVKATYSDNSSETVSVVWDAIPEENYASINSFTVMGTVEGAAMKVEANVTVERAVSIVSIDDVYVKTGIGIAPKLPNTVNVTYDDDTTDTLLVTWPSVEPVLEKGNYTVTGTINGTSTTVNATVEVASVIVLDDFEGGVVSGKTAQSMIKWTGDSVSSTPPSLSYDSNIKYSGNSSLRVDYELSKAASTGSAYVRPNQGAGIVFKPGEVPQKIGFWVYGNNKLTNFLRAEFRAGTTITSANTNQNITNTLDFTGWKYMEYSVDPAYQNTGLTITLLPGIIASSASAKVDGTIYIDDVVAIYGAHTLVLESEILAAEQVKNTATVGTENGQYPVEAIEALDTAISAALTIKSNAETQKEIDDAVEALKAAVNSFKAAQIIKVDTVSLNQTTLTLNVGNEYQLIATITPSAVTNKNVTWISSDEAIATVDATGKVTALSEGEATITVITEDGNKTATAIVTVTLVPITIDESKLDEQILIASNLRDEAQIGTSVGQYPIEAKDALETAIATAIAVKGAVLTQEDINSAVENLELAISLFKQSVILEENENTVVHVTGVSLNKQTLELTIAHQEQLVAVISPSNADLQQVIWTSSNENVATVDSLGVVIAKNSGTAIITVTTVDGNFTASSVVNVSAPYYNPPVEEQVDTPVGGETNVTDETDEISETDETVNVDTPFNELVNMDYINALVENAKDAPALTFNDIPTDSSVAKTVELATKLGIIKGYEDGSFKADAPVTRAEFAAMLVQVLGLTSQDNSNFKDTEDHWASDAIAALKSNGIINGYLDGTFKPNQNISRAEIVAMLAKVMKTTSVNEVKFNDVSGSWAEEEINQLSEMGIIKGTSDGVFAPNGKATRYESLLMILRMLNVSLNYSLDVE